ncbi:MAG: hypothetical protein HKN12_07325, partial [Gemmatimonadetes bacterium]|nr:hypothetical protein [Gemmatimonadota bacterium]
MKRTTVMNSKPWRGLRPLAAALLAAAIVLPGTADARPADDSAESTWLPTSFLR